MDDFILLYCWTNKHNKILTFYIRCLSDDCGVYSVVNHRAFLPHLCIINILLQKYGKCVIETLFSIYCSFPCCCCCFSFPTIYTHYNNIDSLYFYVETWYIGTFSRWERKAIRQWIFVNNATCFRCNLIMNT